MTELNDATNNPLGLQPGYSLVDARLTYDSADAAWEAALLAQNIFDHYINKFISGHGATSGVTRGWVRPNLGR